MPRGIEVGFNRGASIYHGNVFKKYYITNILGKTKKFDIPYKFFGSEKEALSWFDSFEND